MSKLGDFWKNVQFYKDDILGQTCIAEQDYESLKSNHKLIFKSEWDTVQQSQRIKPSYNRLFHAQLPAEPFVGNLDADIYIITLNPGVGKEEYENWQNNTLIRLKDNCLKQGKTDYPFYYLDPLVSGTGGAKYWLERVPGQSWMHHKFYDIVNILEQKTGNRDAAIKKIANKICDLEFCPYHSVNWDGPEVIKSLPSVQAMIDFLKNIVVPGVITGNKTLIVGRNVKQINELLSDVTFEYKGEQISFNDLDRLFKNNVVFYRDPVSAQQMRMDSGSPAGDLLLEKLI